MKNVLNEETIGAISQKYFQAKGWETYPEVVIPIFGGRPDLVCAKHNLCMVAEAKMALTFPVIEQLVRWHLDYEEAKQSTYRNLEPLAIPHLMVACNEAVCMAELCGEDFDVGLDDPSEKIDQYLPLGTREILKTNREILLQSYRISNFIHRTQLGEQSVITALVNATQELSRIKGELKERSDTKVVLKVNEKILRTCKAILAERGFQL